MLCTGISVVVVARGYSLVVVCRLLIAVAYLLQSMGCRVWASVVEVCPMEDCEVRGGASSRVGGPGAPAAVQSMRCPGGSYNR